jgi:NAD(P)-dependent dehydrogenase (short-subunit alcohol dehydrogenase family)
MRLKDKVGIVTAAASGMGRAGALRFAREGAADGVADIDAAGAEAVVAEIKAEGGRAIALAGDLRQDTFASGIVAETAKAFGGPTSSGTMSAIPVPPPSRTSTWQHSSWLWT